MENSEIKISEGTTSIEVKLNNNSVCLSQKQMAYLFNKNSDTIELNLKNIYKSAELKEESITEKYSVVNIEGKRKVNRKITKTKYATKRTSKHL